MSMMKNNKPTADWITESEGCYFCGEDRITNFVVDNLTITEAGEDEKELRFTLRSDYNEIFNLFMKSSDFASVASVRNALSKNQIGLSYMATLNQHEAFKAYLWNNITEIIKGVKASGMYFTDDDKCIYVEGNRAVNKDGENVFSHCQINKFTGIKSEILDYDEIEKDKLKSLLYSLFSHNEIGISLTVLSWCAAVFVKEHLSKAGHKFPHLCLEGEAGSGKSTVAERIILPMFSISGVKAAGMVKTFTLLKEGSSSKMFPTVIDEFKPAAIKTENAIYDYLRNSYDNHVVERGKQDQTVTRYKIESRVVLCGESSPDEAAVRERMMLCVFRKDKTEEYIKHMAYLTQNEDEVHRLGRTLLNTALSLTAQEVENFYQSGLRLSGSNLPPRIRNNIACIIAGIGLIQRMCYQKDLDWSDYSPYSLEECIGAIVALVKDNLLNGRETNRSVIDDTFEVFARMGLIHGSDYIIRYKDGKSFLCIRLNKVYDRYTKYRKDHSIGGEYLTKGRFEQQLKKSSYFVASNKPIRFTDGTGKQYKCFIVDYDQLSEKCDVSGFIEADRYEVNNPKTGI